ncbi:hypothetical protein Achl_1133 [Pseudarthrobacter chlorophenolicus A6]|uniref:Uncharacterized protein n=1 Tax=Pseudarthrobacter chlorophenolicus (strain ATCC 700700 / DSM 12829 / CIP 107037 / JCM 12360 / KCTC 9906 / NCIMB 13794 / A6) TaxID=452863 RepID=B8HE89_PSECP|nr:hypothetical protein [Pseudarthrobacter chlorophenolicus]ACL39124.1 hypothetical protein Achl_1133 [Pseudarthrobacter chlorophenolicus A6]SDR04063.1 hypothetical protein SAMN04489738_4394 [Pseudarthrobacter chlorophenolicus]
MKKGWGILGTLAAAMPGLLPLTGCTPYACTAIGWTNSLTVTVGGNPAAVSEVRLCDEKDRCSRPAPTPADPLPLRSVVPTFDPTTGTPEPAPESEPYPLFTVTREGDTWNFMMGMNAPPRATISALTADGTVLASQNVELTWTRVGGSEQCGGPMSTPPLQLRVP